MMYQLAVKLKVALRKESVDRNTIAPGASVFRGVALRKESVDRNISVTRTPTGCVYVALRKESVDRNFNAFQKKDRQIMSLSARRAWIEIPVVPVELTTLVSRSPQGERG